MSVFWKDGHQTASRTLPLGLWGELNLQTKRNAPCLTQIKKSMHAHMHSCLDTAFFCDAWDSLSAHFWAMQGSILTNTFDLWWKDLAHFGQSEKSAWGCQWRKSMKYQPLRTEHPGLVLNCPGGCFANQCKKACSFSSVSFSPVCMDLELNG